MKKLFAVVLCLCMVISMTATALAATPGSTSGGSPTPGGTVGETTTPGGTGGDTTTPGGTSGGSTTPGGTSGGSTTPGGTSGGSTTPGGTSGGSTTPGGTSGGSTTPGGTSGGSTTPGGPAGGSTGVGGAGGVGGSVVVSEPFTDVNETAYYYDALLWAVKNGITNGITDTTFEPNSGCTRAQMVTFLWRASGSPEPTTTKNAFIDVDENAYYYKALLWAIEEGITNGVTATTFDPNAICSRGQMAAFLYRHADTPAVTGDHDFNDVEDADYYHAAVLWALQEGVTNGTTNTTYSPDNNCTRGQMVAFLYRYFAA